MNIFEMIVIGVCGIAWILFTFKTFADFKRTTSHSNTTKIIVRIAIFGAISALLYVVPVLKFPVPFFPSFLEFHFDEIPALIASFAYGPLTGAAVIVVKTLIKLPFTSTLGVGELADLVFGIALILPAAIIYKKKHNFKGALLGLLVGTIIQLGIVFLLNVLVMIPFYMFVMGFSEEALLAICQMANPAIKDIKWTYGLLAVLPFNAIKDAIIIVVTIIVYKTMHRFMDRLR